MSDTPEDPATLSALVPESPQETPIALVASLPPGGNEHGAELASVVGFKLGAIQFLHHVCMGSWFVTLSSYVSANSGDAGRAMFGAGFIGVAYSAGPLGGMISPFVTGLMADHWFYAEKLIVVLQLLCAAALLSAAAATTQGAFFVAIFAYFLCFHPSSSLATSMALHHLRRPERDYPAVRAAGTIGWVVGGLLIGWFWPWVTGRTIESTDVPMKISAAVSLVTAAFALTLPRTPPANRKTSAAPANGLSRAQLWELLRDKRFAALMLLAVTAHIPSQFYYAYSNVYFNWTKMGYPAAKMTLGQVVEIGAMLLLPAFLLRAGVRAAIGLGMVIWALRFTMMAVGASPTVVGRDALLYAAILLHGIAFTWVTISLQLDVDLCAGRMRRATAQGLFSVAVQGFGCFAGARIAGLAAIRWLPVEVKTATASGWMTFWLLPAAVSAAVAVLAFAILGRKRSPPPSETSA